MRVIEVSMEQRRNESTGKREIPEKTQRPTASSSTIPTCENPGRNQPRIEPGSPWWEARRLTTQSPAASRTTGEAILNNLRIVPKYTWGNLYRYFSVPRSREPMRAIEASVERRRNEVAGETGDPRENPPTNGIVRRDAHMRNSGERIAWPPRPQ
ncbi:hypothetical protein PR048_022871 [Dryococelus australis]|uniref:Uncharacterized protein n=1 Tax=Dryococelus australis TaxID=614101 RepID=A0ABQ9GSF5_9NEOP|nr:hypothetical protein PR048_022871 [Dryococelus australis]